jgi:hypothetical protein
MNSLFTPTFQSRLSGDVRVFDFNKLELTCMRLGFALLVFFAIKWEFSSLGPADPKKLTGLTHLVNLDWLRSLSPMWLWKAITAGGLLLYVLGIVPVLGLFPALFFSIGIGTLANSQGAANHSTQLVSMLLLGQFLVYAIPLLKDTATTAKSWLAPHEGIQQRMAYVSMVVFAAGYVIAGFIKLHNSDWEWIQRVPYLAVELQKSNWSEYYDTLTPVPASLETVVSMMTNHPNVARLLFGGGLLLELLAFLCLLGRRWALGIGIAIIIMHLSISRLMQLDFWYHMAAALIFLINVPGLKRTLTGRGRQ